MLYKAYLRKAHFVDLYYKLEYYESLELNGQYSRQFNKKTKLFAKYIVFIVAVGQLGVALSYFAISISLVNQYPSMHMVISSILGFISTLWAIRTIGALMVTSFYYVFIISLYMKFRFRQIYNDLQKFKCQGISK